MSLSFPFSFSFSLSLSFGLSLSLSLLQRSAVLQNDVNGPARAIDISPHPRYSTPVLAHEREEERERDGEKETEGRGEIARRRDRLPIKTKLVAALSPPPPLRGRMRNLAHYFAPSLLIPLPKRPTEERTNVSTNRHSRVLSPVVVLRVSLSAFFCFPLSLSFFGTLSQSRGLSSPLRACMRVLCVSSRSVGD